MEDYYEILEIQRGAPKKEIKKAFYRLAKKYHPDLNSDEDAGSKFKRINEAYSVLISERSRHEYDQKVEWHYANPDSSSFGFATSTSPMYNSDGSPFYNIDEWYRSHYGPEVAERMRRMGENRRAATARQGYIRGDGGGGIVDAVDDGAFFETKGWGAFDSEMRKRGFRRDSNKGQRRAISTAASIRMGSREASAFRIGNPRRLSTVGGILGVAFFIKRELSS